jgi:hypothetical protein
VLDASKSEELERLISASRRWRLCDRKELTRALCMIRPVTFPTYDYAVTLDAKQIYVVKRATVDAQE